MARDFSFEKNITDGYVQVVREFVLDFDSITILFENAYTKEQKSLHFTKVISLTMEKDEYIFPDDYPSYQTLIGFDFEQIGDIYTYCIKIDEYEIMIKSLDFVELERL